MKFNTDKFLIDLKVRLNRVASESCRSMVESEECGKLFSAFEAEFMSKYGSGIDEATGLDAMKIIVAISNDIDQIAPHISWLFEDKECSNIIERVYNNSFLAWNQKL